MSTDPVIVEAEKITPKPRQRMKKAYIRNLSKELVKMVTETAEKLLNENLENIQDDSSKLNPEFKELMLRESKKIGEDIKKWASERPSIQEAGEGDYSRDYALEIEEPRDSLKITEESPVITEVPEGDEDIYKIIEEPHMDEEEEAIAEAQEEAAEGIEEPGVITELSKALRRARKRDIKKISRAFVKMIICTSQNFLYKHHEKIRDSDKLDDELKEQLLEESKKIGEEFQTWLSKRSFEDEFEEMLKLENEKMLDEIISLKSIDSFCLMYKGDSTAGRRTLAIIKPDAYKYANEIIDVIRYHGFVVVQERRLTLTPEQVSLFYGEHLAKAFSLRLIQHMSSGPIVALCLASAHCPSTVEAWREFMGPSDVAEAVAIFPNTLRAKYGDPQNQVKNALHGSHSLEDAEREIHFFFPDLILDPLPVIKDITSALDDQSLKVLHKGIVTLCREKPADPLSWFAHWLLHNNPNNSSPSYEWIPPIYFDNEFGTGKKCFQFGKEEDGTGDK